MAEYTVRSEKEDECLLSSQQRRSVYTKAGYVEEVTKGAAVYTVKISGVVPRVGDTINIATDFCGTKSFLVTRVTHTAGCRTRSIKHHAEAVGGVEIDVIVQPA